MLKNYHRLLKTHCIIAGKPLQRFSAGGAAFSDDGKSVAQGQDDLLHTGVLSQGFVEGLYAPSLRVSRVRFQHMTIPERVVGQDVTPWIEVLKREFVVVLIETLVSINKDEVVAETQPRNDLQGIAYVEGNLLSVRRVLQPGTGKVLLLIIDFYRVEVSLWGQTFSQAECAVTTVSAYFEHSVGANHLGKHLQDAPLQVSAGHATIEQVQVGSPVETVQVVTFGVDVCPDVIIYMVLKLSYVGQEYIAVHGDGGGMRCYF